MSATNGHSKRKRKPVNRIANWQPEINAQNSGLEIPAKHRKVAIVGKAPSSMNDAPYDDQEWEIWVVGDMGLAGKRVTRSFEVHDIHDGMTRWGTHYTDFLKAKHDFPIYVFDKHPEVQSAVDYPRREVLNRFAPLLQTNEGKSIAYFTNSISWMIALAIHEGVQEIGLWGVDMAQHGVGLLSEYAHQRPSCELWIGIAVGCGIKVQIHQNSDLLKTPYQYGFDTEPHALRLKHKARDNDIAMGQKKAATKATELGDEIERLTGHQEYWESRLLGILGSDDESEAAREKIVDRIAQIKAAIKKVRASQNEQVQRQLIHMGAKDDMQYWHQHHFQ